MPNQYKNKVIYGDSVLMDITDTTAVAADVASGKYFYLASGERVSGTYVPSPSGATLIVDTPDEHGGTIREITTDAIVQLQGQKTVVPSSSVQTIYPDEGYDGFASIIVDSAPGGNVNISQDENGYLVIDSEKPNGGISIEDFATGAEPSGSITLTGSTVKAYAFYGRTNITELIAPNISGTDSIGNYGFYGLRGLKHAFLASWEGSSSTNNYCFANCGSTTAQDCVMVFPSLKNIGSRMFRDGWFKAVDLGSQSLTVIGTDAFYPSTYGSYKTLNLILRRTDGVVTVPASDAIKAVYNLWVPQSLVSSYETASNWSARVSGGYLTVHAIEGSVYEHAYADGTPIN